MEQQLYRFVKASESLDRLPLETFIHVKDNVGCKRMGNFFEDDGKIKFSVCGTEMYESFIMLDLSHIYWLEPIPTGKEVSAEEVLADVYNADLRQPYDLQLQITLNPSLDRIKKAMEEYASQFKGQPIEEGVSKDVEVFKTIKGGEKVCDCPSCGEPIIWGLSEQTLQLWKKAFESTPDDKIQKAIEWIDEKSKEAKAASKVNEVNKAHGFQFLAFEEVKQYLLSIK